MILSNVASVLVTLGLIALIRKKSLLSIWASLQLLILAAGLFFVSAGQLSGKPLVSYVVGIFIVLFGLISGNVYVKLKH